MQIADFGLSQLIAPGQKLTKVCGTWAYAAPEMSDHHSGGYDCKFDTWSFGVILFVVLCGYHPFDPDGNLPVPEVSELGGGVHHPYVATSAPPSDAHLRLNAPCARHLPATPPPPQIKARARAATFDFNQVEWDNVSDSAKDLLRKLIVKNPGVSNPFPNACVLCAAYGEPRAAVVL